MKNEFLAKLKEFAKTLNDYVSTNSGDWSIKGFIDVDKNIYTISSDTKIICERPPAKAGGFELRLKAGLIGHSAD